MLELTHARDPQKILKPVNLQLASGSYGVVGPNAAGKTTLLSLLHDATLPSSAFARAAADAEFAGATRSSHRRCAALARPDFDYALFDRLTDGDAVRTMSAGQRRRLTLASAFAAGTQTLLLDEPFEGTDRGTRHDLRQALFDIMTSHVDTLIVSAHRTEDLVGLVDAIITVHDGRVAGPFLLDDIRPHYPTIVGDVPDGARVLETATLGSVQRSTIYGPVPGGELPDDARLIDLLATHERT